MDVSPATEQHPPQQPPARPGPVRFSLLKNLSIGSRLTIGFGLLVVLLLVISSLNHASNQRAVRNISLAHTMHMPTTLASASARANLLKMRASIHSYLILGDANYRTDYEQARADFEADLEHLHDLSPAWTDPESKRRLAQITTLFDSWQALPERLFELHNNQLANQPAVRILTTEGEPAIALIQNDTTGLIQYQASLGPTEQNMALLEDLIEFQNTFALMISNLRGYLATQDPSFKEAYQIQQSINDSAWGRMVAQTDLLTATVQQARLERIGRTRDTFLLLPPRMFTQIESQHAYEDRYIFRTRAAPLADQMLFILDELTANQQDVLQEDLNQGSSALSLTQWQAIAGGIVVVVVGMGLVLLFRRSIAIPLWELTSVSRRIAGGDWDARAPDDARDETGTLARAFNTMTHHMRYTNQELEAYSHSLEQRVKQRTSELAQAVQDAITARTLAEEANRAKSMFLANMSHELRTPLNAIIGYSEMLHEEAEDGEIDHPTFGEDLHHIHTAGTNLLRIISDILDISRLEAGKMELYIETFELSRLLQQVLETIQPQVEQNGNTLEVRRDETDAMMLLSADYARMQQILLNLLGNATKFTEQGHIILTVSSSGGANHDQTSDPHVVFEIRDTGIGITPDQMQKLFQPFSQVDDSNTRRFGGTGLGLAISKQYCQMMGGDITVESEPGRGTTFTVSIPAQVCPLPSVVTYGAKRDKTSTTPQRT